MTLTNPIAANGCGISLNPPHPLFDVGQDAVDQAYKELARAFFDYAETVKAFELERDNGMGSSAASFYGGQAAKDACQDHYVDFVEQY